jgi:hypothetical protein
MKKSIIYTDSASKKLDSILNNFKQRLTDDIQESKNYPGEELIEITASDIEEIYERVTIRSRRSKNGTKSSMIRLILPIYFIAGIALVLYGFFSEQIQQLINNDRNSIIYILTGFIISLTTGTMYYLIKQRESERKRDLYREKFDIERELLEREISKIKIEKIESK